MILYCICINGNTDRKETCLINVTMSFMTQLVVQNLHHPADFSSLDIYVYELCICAVAKKKTLFAACYHETILSLIYLKVGNLKAGSVHAVISHGAMCAPPGACDWQGSWQWKHWIILWVIRETRVSFSVNTVNLAQRIISAWVSVNKHFYCGAFVLSFLKPRKQQLTDLIWLLIPKSKWCWWSSLYFENNDRLQCAVISICSIWVNWSHSTCVHYFSPGLLSITWHPLPLPLCIHA